jgi:hypothetical protein
MSPNFVLFHDGAISQCYFDASTLWHLPPNGLKVTLIQQGNGINHCLSMPNNIVFSDVFHDAALVKRLFSFYNNHYICKNKEKKNKK